MKTLLFIPTYNVESTVYQVLAQIPQDLRTRFDRILVFDNCSQDQTVSEVQRFATNHPDIKIEIYANEQNYFLGGSTILALKRALALNADWLICMHSDGQAAPEDLTHFFKAIDQDRYDFILGSRLLSESRVQNYSWPRLMMNGLMSRLQFSILRQDVRDLGSFVGFNLHCMQQFPFAQVPHDMGYHPLLLLTMARDFPRALRFYEFPIYWGKVENSNVNVWTYTLRHLFRLLRLKLGLRILRFEAPALHTREVLQG